MIFRIIHMTLVSRTIVRQLTPRNVPPAVTTSKMIGQSKISTFFKPAPQKRTTVSTSEHPEAGPSKKSRSREGPVQDPEAGPSKKSGSREGPVQDPEAGPSKKSGSREGPEPQPPASPSSNEKAGGDASTPERPTVPSSHLSPEQKNLVAEKQLEAKCKLAAKTTHGLVVGFGLSWFKSLQLEFSKPYFQQLCKFVSSEREKSTVYPPPDQVFTFTRMCDIRQVKVVIIGQDPYHGPKQAHGLSFSVQEGIKSPPSLVNMYKELTTDIEGFSDPRHGNLTGWAEQGVLMLNACLTVRAHNANSHQGKGWEQFTDAIIMWLNRNLHGVVFLLWGAYAQKKGAHIDKKKHHILKAVHPSPLSAHRGFFGCKHFSQCNKLLRDQRDEPIDWTLLPKC